MWCKSFNWLRMFLFVSCFLMGCKNFEPLRSSDESLSIKRVETYLNNANGFKGNFKQIWPNGNISLGEITYLPGKLKLTYNYPSAMIAVAKENHIVAKDYSNQSMTRIGLKHNPLGLMLNTPVRLHKPILVTSLKHFSTLLQISLASSDNPSQGLLTLRFLDNGKNLDLIQMQAVDARKHLTVLNINDIQYNPKLSSNFFSYPQP